MEKVFKVGKVFLAIFVLAALIFAGTQSLDPVVGWLMGGIGVINGFVLVKDMFTK